MRLVFWIFLAMSAFAANSVLNRAAVDNQWITPEQFSVLRVLSGAAVLTVLCLGQGHRLVWTGTRRIIGALSLAIYMIGFSLAYLVLDAGLGALILFGVVQIAIFVATAATGGGVTARQVAGTGVAFAGLTWVLWPGAGGLTAPFGAMAMGAAGLGWAGYTMAGRGERDALAATTANFCLCLPLVALVFVFRPIGPMPHLPGVLLAAISGGVTSALGYALWYRILPEIAATTAATVQLMVPVFAIIAGIVLLGEAPSLNLGLAALVVLGGIWLAVTGKRA